MSTYEIIKMLCKKNGVSVSFLEKELGFSNASISKWKKSAPGAESVKKVADYFGVTIDYLISGDSGEKSKGYYLNEETAKLAQEMYEDEDMRSLFDMKRNMPPERFKAHMEFMKNLYKQEKGE